jgi:molecular chaperone DnaK
MTEDRRREPRVPAELNLKLAFGSVREFLDRYSLNISRGGIFVRTLQAVEPGTEVALNIEIGTGERVIRGRGIVRWNSPPSAPGESPQAPGMGIKFISLEPESRALVEEVVAARGHAANGEEPPIPVDEGAAGPEEAVDLSELVIDEPAGQAPGPPAPPPAAAAAPTVSAPRTAPRRAGPRSKIVGIDLGTTNSCVAYSAGGRAQVLTSRRGHRTIPSVVAYDEHGRLLVGQAAKAQMVINPKNTVYGSKRLVGRPFRSPTVQACRDRFHYDIVEGPNGEAAVRFAGRDFSLQQVAAFVLGDLKETASEALGELVTRAVVTVPAYYNDHQRQAVREAGALAGLEVERIVNEPTAAALAFGYGRGIEKRVLVYDLGGGTFDASVLDIQGDIYEVISTGGDIFLGGVDFDNQLGDHLVYRFMEQNGVPPPEDRVVWQRLRDAAEETKVALSGRETAVAHVPYLCKDASGRDVELQVEVSRAELEGLTGRLVDRTVEVAREVLSARNLGAADVNEVLLVGGQSRMPLVWRKIREAFGREPNKSVHPDEAVALGAALLADSDSRIDSVVLIDVLAMAIGVGLAGGRMVPVLARNTRLPARRSYDVSTTRDGQTELEVAVFQGDSPKASECEYLGTVRVTGLPPAPRGTVRIAVDFALGPEGILSVSARNLATGQVTAARLATLDTPESLRDKLQMTDRQVAPRGARPIEADPASAVASAVPSASPGAEAARRGLLGRLFGKK